MDKEIAEVADERNDEIAKDARTADEGKSRLELYMQITAAATSVIVLAIMFLLLYYIRNTVIIFALSFLVAYILGPAVRFFERRGISSGQSSTEKQSLKQSSNLIV